MCIRDRYYYLKLKENFFDSDSIVLLEDMKDGILYSNILLKMYLKSLKNGGKLQLDEHIPYTCLLYTSNSAVGVLQTLVVALGAGLGIWGVINLLEGYGQDNPASNAHIR